MIRIVRLYTASLPVFNEICLLLLRHFLSKMVIMQTLLN